MNDSSGLVIAEVDEDGRKNQLEYDNFQRFTKQLDPIGNGVQFGYHISDGSVTGQLGSLGEPTQIDYPSFSQLNRFDSRERLTSQSLKYRNTQGERATTSAIAYDTRGQVLMEIDANGDRRTHRYNAFNQRIETIDALGGKTSSRFDVRGNLSELKDGLGNAHNFEYDRNDRVIKETRPLSQSTLFQYDTAGNLTQKTDSNGNRHDYTLDEVNRVIRVVQKSAIGTLLRTTTREWDTNDNLIAWNDTDHSENRSSSSTLTYDDLNRKTGETVIYASGHTLGYQVSYSLAGKKTSLTWPDGTRIDYEYSQHGELENILIPGEGRISVNEYGWFLPKKTTLPGGTTQNRDFDGLLNMESLSVKTPGQQMILNLSNQYGKLQELKTRIRTDSTNNTSTSKSEQFSYDAESRLTRVQSDSGGMFSTVTESFTLDAMANRIAHSGTSGGSAYDANNRLTKTGNGACGDSGNVCYEWDAAGNLIKRTIGGNTVGVTEYRYDSQNRLKEVRDGSNQLIARYGYDPLDRRIWKEQFRDKAGQVLAQALRTYFLYGDEGLIAESQLAISLSTGDTVTTSGDPQITTQYGPRPESQFTTGTIFIKAKNSNGVDTFAYYHHDHLNTPILATDRRGNIVWAASYNAFGHASITTPTATAENPTISSSLRLPGQYEDSETGLHYNFRRYYDPKTGRYVTSDPIGLDGGLNLFLYANSDPINVSDPTGEVPIILIPVAFCARFPRLCATIFACIRNPARCRQGFCKVITRVYKAACKFPGCGDDDFIEALNPNSLKVVQAKIEPSLARARADQKFQFERHSYFVADGVDHTTKKPVFNFSVGLKDSWGK